MQVHWSDWFSLGLMVGIAIFMTGWYVRDHVTRRRVSAATVPGADAGRSELPGVSAAQNPLKQ